MVLDNAIKFSPAGGDVQVTVEETDNCVSIGVQDKGVGIPAEALPHIFDRFFHVEEIGDDLFGGLGLGLAITNQVIEQHGGKILVESEGVPGKGSKFTICLQTAEAEQ
jgi:signal transduction histidine kinase